MPTGTANGGLQAQEACGPFESTERSQPARNFRTMLATVVKDNGVAGGVGNALAITEATPPSLSVNVDTGGALLGDPNDQLFWYDNPAAFVYANFNTAHSTLPRIDTVGVLLDSNTTELYGGIQHITGTPNANPTAPTNTYPQDSTQYFLPLANVTIRSGALTILNSDIEDVREHIEYRNLVNTVKASGTSDAVQDPNTRTVTINSSGRWSRRPWKTDPAWDVSYNNNTSLFTSLVHQRHINLSALLSIGYSAVLFMCDTLTISGQGRLQCQGIGGRNGNLDPPYRLVPRYTLGGSPGGSPTNHSGTQPGIPLLNIPAGPSGTLSGDGQDAPEYADYQVEFIIEQARSTDLLQVLSSEFGVFTGGGRRAAHGGSPGSLLFLVAKHIIHNGSNQRPIDCSGYQAVPSGNYGGAGGGAVFIFAEQCTGASVDMTLSLEDRLKSLVNVDGGDDNAQYGAGGAGFVYAAANW